LLRCNSNLRNLLAATQQAPKHLSRSGAEKLRSLLRCSKQAPEVAAATQQALGCQALQDTCITWLRT
jgi:hypothetical protein